jgi:hypothetical protein
VTRSEACGSAGGLQVMRRAGLKASDRESGKRLWGGAEGAAADYCGLGSSWDGPERERGK